MVDWIRFIAGWLSGGKAPQQQLPRPAPQLRRRPPPAPLPQSQFPSHRLAALKSLDDSLELYPAGVFRDRLRMLRTALGDNAINSFLLPMNGLFLDPRLPWSVNLADCVLPFSQFILEFCISEDWYAHAQPGNKRPHTLLLLVQSNSNGELRLWSLMEEIVHGAEVSKGNLQALMQQAQRGTLDQMTDTTVSVWAVSPVGLNLSRKSSIGTHPLGRPVLEHVGVTTIAGDTPRSAEQRIACIRDYSHEIQALLQFLILCNERNIRPSQIAAPAGALGKCFVLKAIGPTPFAWLPSVASEMTAV